MKIILPLLFCLSILSVASAETQHEISIKKFKFSPAEITVQLGDSIRWTNKEKRQYHSVWFEKLGEPEPDYFFPGEFYERTFKDLGDFPYRCGPHPKMTGQVHVIKAGKPAKKTNTKITYLVESVEDGDTLVIQYKGKSQRVQLVGIDAPEDTQNPKLNIDSNRKKISKADLLEMGKLATEHLKTLVKPEQAVLLEGNLKQKDKYDRLPAIVINTEGESINQRMVADGYALLLTRFPLDEAIKSSLYDAQEKAQVANKGLWESHSDLMKKWSN